MIYLFIAIMLAFLVYASINIQGDFFLAARSKIATEKKEVILSFDDGIDPIQTPKVLDVLKENGLKAQFFLIGERAAAHPKIVKRMAKEGHVVGNHSYAHEYYFPLKFVWSMRADLQKTQVLLEELTGSNITYFRPPFGVTNPTLAKVCKQLDYTVVGWSIRSLDTKKEPRELILARIRKQLHPGAIILLHDHLPDSEKLLKELLELLKNEGYAVVPPVVERKYKGFFKQG